jgi:hypothetical protein
LQTGLPSEIGVMAFPAAGADLLQAFLHPHQARGLSLNRLTALRRLSRQMLSSMETNRPV